MEFVSIDVEIANPDLASICQVGVAHYQHGKLVRDWVTYVDPRDYFAGINGSIHGIDEGTVEGAPAFGEVAAVLGDWLAGRVVVSHSSFDRTAVHQAAARHGGTIPECRWLDTVRVVRRAWPDQFARRGYGLAPVANFVGYEFTHHDALADAKAAGAILLAAVEATGTDLDGWLQAVRQPISGPIEREGNPEGNLFGEVIVFTGALEVPRREAAALAAEAGCTVAANVTKKTTLLVVGDQDVVKLKGKEKSSKHQKAEKYIADGQPIRILRETDFKSMLSSVSPQPVAAESPKEQAPETEGSKTASHPAPRDEGQAEPEPQQAEPPTGLSTPPPARPLPDLAERPERRSFFQRLLDRFR